MKKIISVIVPCYNEEESLPYFYKEMNQVMTVMDEVNFELMFINDGSKDHTLEELKQLNKEDKRVKYLSFSRNFGKEAAILAGLQHVSGDYVTLMDADLQDPPKMLIKMFQILTEEDLDIVGLKSNDHKNYGLIRKFCTACYYKLVGSLCNVPMRPNERDYRLMTRQVVNEILRLTETNRYSKGLFNYVGFITKWISYDAPNRVAGKTTWNFWKLFSYGIGGIVGFSTKPLIFSFFLGASSLFISFVMLIIMAIKAIVNHPVSSLYSVYFIILLMGGFILLFLGIIGEYISQMFGEIKNRPIYIIRETEEGLYENKD